MDTISQTQALGRRHRRSYEPSFKADVVAACQQPGISVAAAALASGNAASVDESAKAAVQLNEQADHLVELVGGFMLDNEEDSPVSESSSSQYVVDSEPAVLSAREVRTPRLGLAA